MISVSNRDYIKLYSWRFVSILSGFLSMLVVVPHISRDQELFGIYSFIMSLALYLTYADFGFLTAGQKYAAEAYAEGNVNGEYRIIGFTLFLLTVMSIPFVIIMSYLSLNPTLIISDLSSNGREISSKLFLRIALFLPFQVLLQRMVQSVLSIRLKDYLFLRIDLISNVVKILSVFWFFDTDYLLVEYVTFGILLTILSQVIILVSLKITQGYEVIKVLRAIGFSREIYKQMSKLAFSSLLMTVAWILYYELDLIFIGRLLGASHVAIYAVSFTFLNFTRTLWNAFYAPFSHRFNHLVGQDLKSHSDSLLHNLIERTFPLTAIVIIVLVISTECVIYAWVGSDYSDSITVLRILLLGSLTVSINKPVVYYLTAHINYKFLHVNAIVTPVVFFSSLFLLMPDKGLLGFAWSKTIAVFASCLVASVFIKGVYSPLNLLKAWYREVLAIVVSIYPMIYLFSIVKQNILEHGSFNLILVLSVVLILILVMTSVLFLISVKFRKVILDIVADR
jgi:O-antigen/teichoic acid export membrane protein